MKKNMGTVDRIIRTIIALALIALFALNVIQGTVSIVLICIAIVFLLTSTVGLCPLYSLLGLSTMKKKIHTKTN